MVRSPSFAFVLFALLVCSTRSSAQVTERDPEIAPAHTDEAESSAFPLRLTERPLTLPRGKVALTSNVGVEYLSFEEIGDECVMTLDGLICRGDESADYDRHHWGTSAGVAVGAIDALEIGLVPLRLREEITPDGEREVFRDPLLYLQTTVLRHEVFQFGFGYQVLLPFRSDTRLMTQRVTLDLLARSRFVRGEATAFVRFDSPVRRRMSFAVNERVISPGVAARVTGQIADPFAVFFGFQSVFFGSSVEGHVTNISTGFVGTVRRSTGEPVADIGFSFGALDLRRPDEPRVVPRGGDPGGRDDFPCELAIRGEVPERCGGVPSSTPLRRFTFELSATFYFHDAW